MRLEYYPDVTPKDYEPPFFRCENPSGEEYRFVHDPTTMTLGHVDTGIHGYHKLTHHFTDNRTSVQVQMASIVDEMHEKIHKHAPTVKPLTTAIEGSSDDSQKMNKVKSEMRVEEMAVEGDSEREELQVLKDSEENASEMPKQLQDLSIHAINDERQSQQSRASLIETSKEHRRTAPSSPIFNATGMKETAEYIFIDSSADGSSISSDDLPCTTDRKEQLGGGISQQNRIQSDYSRARSRESNKANDASEESRPSGVLESLDENAEFRCLCCYQQSDGCVVRCLPPKFVIF